MNIEQEIKELKSRIALLESELQPQEEYDWDNAPVICRIDEYEYRLGPQAPELLDWQEAKNWCEQIGGELPERQILLMCCFNEKIKSELSIDNYYWSITEFSATGAWYQNFTNGSQNTSFKTYRYFVRAIRRLAI